MDGRDDAVDKWRERFFRWVVKRFDFGADLSFKSLLFVCIRLGMGGGGVRSKESFRVFIRIFFEQYLK